MQEYIVKRRMDTKDQEGGRQPKQSPNRWIDLDVLWSSEGVLRNFLPQLPT